MAGNTFLARDLTGTASFAGRIAKLFIPRYSPYRKAMVAEQSDPTLRFGPMTDLPRLQFTQYNH